MGDEAAVCGRPAICDFDVNLRLVDNSFPVKPAIGALATMSFLVIARNLQAPERVEGFSGGD